MSLSFLSTPPSSPCHFLGMSASFSMYVPFFRCESFPYISRRADWFPCPLFSFHSPCTPLVFISVPFMSLSVPLCFPFISPCFPAMSTSYFLPFLAFPLCSPVFPAKKHGFSSVFAKRTSTNTVFPDLRQKEAGNPNQQRAGRGIRAWDPCFATPAPWRLRLVERHQITARRAVRDVGRGGGGGGVILSAMSVDMCSYHVGIAMCTQKS